MKTKPTILLIILYKIVFLFISSRVENDISRGLLFIRFFVSENKRSFSFIFLINTPLDIVIYTVYPKIIIITYKNSF